MDYEMKYKNALEWARQVMNGETGFIREEVAEVFDELAESMDERIRKALIRFHRSTIELDGIKGEKLVAWLEKQGKQNYPIPSNSSNIGKNLKVGGFDAELDALLKKYEHLPKKELQEPLEFYLGVVRDDLDVVRENPTKYKGWVNIYKHEDVYTLSSEILNTVEEARKYWNKNTVATIKIEWEEGQQ